MGKKQKAILGLKQSIANRRRDMICIECQGDYKQFKNARRKYSRAVYELKRLENPKPTDLAKADFLQDYTGPNVFEN